MISFTKDDVFLVTGGSSGLGRAISFTINELGGTVVAVARDKRRLAETAKEAANPDAFHVETMDMAENLEDIPAFVKECASRYGKLRGFVHSAGMVDLTPVKGVTLEKLKKIFDINFTAGLMLAKGISRKNVNAGNNVSLVFISSYVTISGHPGQTMYASSKGAINSMVKSMAVELSRQDITVNAVLPGHIVTRGSETYDDLYSEEYKHELKNMYPMGPGSPENVADLVAFLLSDRARWITGQNIVIDGGRCLL